MQKTNTNYNPDKREQGNDVYMANRPFQTMMEQLVSAQLASLASAEYENRKPPIRNIGKVAPRFGYRTTPLTLMDLVRGSTDVPSSFGDWSGTVSGYEGTSYPSLRQL